MTEGFARAAEAVERACTTSWRLRFKRGEFRHDVDTVMFNFVEGDGEWKFALSLRSGGEWFQGTYRCEPADMDPLSDGFVSPVSFAMEASEAVLHDLSKVLRARDAWYE